MPALLVYRALLAETSARRLVVSDASLRTGILLDLAEPAAAARRGLRAAGAGERGGGRAPVPVRRRARPARADARDAALRRLRDEHGLADRERLLLQAAALLHDIGVYVSLRAHHKHSQYILAASQIFGLSHDETAIVANIARYHRGGLRSAATCRTPRSTATSA